jgi:hypothetical protein
VKRWEDKWPVSRDQGGWQPTGG